MEQKQKNSKQGSKKTKDLEKLAKALRNNLKRRKAAQLKEVASEDEMKR